MKTVRLDIHPRLAGPAQLLCQRIGLGLFADVLISYGVSLCQIIAGRTLLLS